MTISRRGFLSAILAAATAPAIVKAENIAKIWVPKQKILTWADFNGTGLDATDFITHKIRVAASEHLPLHMPPGIYTVYKTIELAGKSGLVGPGSVVEAAHDKPIFTVAPKAEVTFQDLYVERLAQYSAHKGNIPTIYIPEITDELNIQANPT